MINFGYLTAFAASNYLIKAKSKKFNQLKTRSRKFSLSQSRFNLPKFIISRLKP